MLALEASIFCREAEKIVVSIPGQARDDDAESDDESDKENSDNGRTREQLTPCLGDCPRLRRRRALNFSQISKSSCRRNILGAIHRHSAHMGRIGEEAEMVNTGHIVFAEALVFVHGAEAEAEAARHAILCERSGDADTAETWRLVQRAVARMPTPMELPCAA